LKRRGATGRTEGAEPDSVSHTAAVERAMEETRTGKRAVVTEVGGLIVTIAMEMGVGIVMEVTDMADAVARIVAIVVMMEMTVLSAGEATAIVIVIVIAIAIAIAIDMEEGAIANVVVIASAKIAATGIDRRIAGGEVPRQMVVAAAA
jgi:hypothetical protein